jgi:hypothetical protein
MPKILHTFGSHCNAINTLAYDGKLVVTSDENGVSLVCRFFQSTLFFFFFNFFIYFNNIIFRQHSNAIG